ncbi:Uu.00g129180.m01.CDS01 [Anthostomella pinea]|uniref:Uu.00g129180.m01.CDS01 n=1 Tax=Anthostomella pinea TaxID=933095 RepID=A0AAI8VIF3_9PEZI|nr:Uu.00g129180.m01.CDS01 [Anthostomella pinea]
MMSNASKRLFNTRMDLRFIAYLVISLIFTFHVLVLTGCLLLSPGIPDLFVFKLQLNQSEGYEVRVGYYGICAEQLPGRQLACQASYMRSADALEDFFLSNSTLDSDSIPARALLSSARTFQNNVFYPLLAGSGALIFLSTISMLLLKRSIKNPKFNPNTINTQKRFRSGMLVLGQLAFGLAVAAAFSTTQTVGALHFATTKVEGSLSDIIITSGIPVQGLQWTMVAMIAFLQWSMSSMFPEGQAGMPPMRAGPGMGMPPPPPPPPPMGPPRF